MAPERVTITVRSDLGEDGPLTVSDALRQVLDFFDLVAMAEGDNSSSIGWRLVSIAKNSPLEAIAEPYPLIPGIDIEHIARNAKRAAVSALADITSDVGVPAWMDAPAREKARMFLARNTNGIGRTDIKVDDKSPALMVSQRRANVGLATLEKAETEIAAQEPDLSRHERGSIEGFVTDATTYRRQPALKMRDRRTGADVLCVFSDELASQTGDHAWREVWDGERISVYGRIQYNRKGVPTSIRADGIREIRARELSYSDICDSDFTAGLEPVEYLQRDAEVA